MTGSIAAWRSGQKHRWGSRTLPMWPMAALMLLLFHMAQLAWPLPVSAAVYTEAEKVPNERLKDRTSFISNPDKIITPADAAEINLLAAGVKSLLGVEIAVVALGDIGDNEPREFANALFNLWGVGQKDEDNGLLILLVTKPPQRSITFETGYGLEAVMPDVVCYRLQQEHMLTDMKAGRYSVGLRKGVVAVGRHLLASGYVSAAIEKTEQEKKPKTTEQPKAAESPKVTEPAKVTELPKEVKQPESGEASPRKSEPYRPGVLEVIVAVILFFMFCAKMSGQKDEPPAAPLRRGTYGGGDDEEDMAYRSRSYKQKSRRRKREKEKDESEEIPTVIWPEPETPRQSYSYTHKETRQEPKAESRYEGPGFFELFFGGTEKKSGGSKESGKKSESGGGGFWGRSSINSDRPSSSGEGSSSSSDGGNSGDSGGGSWGGGKSGGGGASSRL